MQQLIDITLKKKSYFIKDFFLRKLAQRAGIFAAKRAIHLCFKQAQPKMCHSPKVDDGVDIFLISS